MLELLGGFFGRLLLARHDTSSVAIVILDRVSVWNMTTMTTVLSYRTFCARRRSPAACWRETKLHRELRRGSKPVAQWRPFPFSFFGKVLLQTRPKMNALVFPPLGI